LITDGHSASQGRPEAAGTTTTASELKNAEESCRTALRSRELCGVDEQLAARGFDAWSALERVNVRPESVAHLLHLAHSLRCDEVDFARCLLLQGSLSALPRVAAWRVFEGVKRLWAEDVLYYCQPAGDLRIFSPAHIRFREMAKIVTLRRGPAGQFHWEAGGVPRSWIVHTTPWRWPGLFRVLFRLRGFGPLVETHINARRKNRPILTEAEGIRSYYRIARSIELQPEIQGLVAFSWLYCAETGRVTPHLQWLRRFFVERGAFVESVGAASPDSGFLVGSEERRRRYDEGKYRPQMTYVLWTRDQILRWARETALEHHDPRL